VRPSLACHSVCGPGYDSDIICGSVGDFGWTYLAKTKMTKRAPVARLVTTSIPRQLVNLKGNYIIS